MMKEIHNNSVIRTLMSVAISLAGGMLCQSALAFTYQGLNYSIKSSSSQTVSVSLQNESKSLTGTIEIPAKVSSNGSVYTVTAIDDNAFIHCSNIMAIKVPATVTTIGGGSFAYCSSLETLDLGSGVTSIGADLFTGVSNLKTMISRNPNPPTIKNWGTVKSNATLYVPEIAIKAYRNASVWSYFQNIKDLGPYGEKDDSQKDPQAFFKGLKTLTVGNQVEAIDDGMFSGYTNLASVTFGTNVATIGENAFNGCTALTEVELGPSVAEIGANAFAGCNLTDIRMGSNVTSIGEKAFDQSPATTVAITAQVPPTAPDNTFSSYTGTLYVQDQSENRSVIDAYYDSDYCWYRFNSVAMVVATDIEHSSEPIKYEAGKTQQLSARLLPENVTLPTIYWYSDNTDVASVSPTGLVTFHAIESDDEESLARAAAECRIIATTLYADGPVAEFTVEGINTSIPSIGNNGNDGTIDYSEPYDVYNLNGIRVSDNTDSLIPGIYIIRQGNIAKKVAIR